MMPMLEIRNLGKTFYVHELQKEIAACSKIDLDVGDGEFVGITGKSGSGKSTILKLIYRTYSPQTGSIVYRSNAFGPVDLCRVGERTVLALRRFEIGYISQFLGVIPRTSARELLKQSVLDRGGDDVEAEREAVAMLEHFEIERSLWDSYVSTFSGGEKLRLNIARAMVKKPRILLLDEPTASLDRHSKERVRQLLVTLKNQGTTMLGIFHDLEFMDGLCDREFSMSGGSFDSKFETLTQF